MSTSPPEMLTSIVPKRPFLESGRLLCDSVGPSKHESNRVDCDLWRAQSLQNLDSANTNVLAFCQGSSRTMS